MTTEGLFARPRRAPAAGTTGGAGAASGAEAAAPAAAPPGAQPHRGFVLLDRFRDFHIVLTREKRQILTGSAAASATAAPAGAAASDAAPAGPWQVLLSLLQAQARAAARVEAAASYAEAQYLMAAFADEIFLDLVWPGRAAWAANPLEHELFGSDDGRDVVFERIDALLARGVAADPDLARTYLLALALGFRGRYRVAEERSHLDAYRERLVEALYQHGLEPEPAAAPGLLFPDAYLATRGQGERRKLPWVRFWTAALLSALVLYAIFSYRVWDSATAPLAAAVAKVLAIP
jgi:type VI secretion system protein ImpK